MQRRIVLTLGAKIHRRYKASANRPPELVDEDTEGASSSYKIKFAEPSELDTLIGKLTSLTCGSKVVPRIKLGRDSYAI